MRPICKIFAQDIRVSMIEEEKRGILFLRSNRAEEEFFLLSLFKGPEKS